MCPACVIGVVFLAQLMGSWRWFRRVILKKPVKDEELYWKPQSMLTPRMQAFAADKKKVAVTLILLAAESTAAVVIYKMDGFMFISKLFGGM